MRRAALLLLAPLVAGCASSASHRGDVKVESCSRTDFTGPVATLRITNSGAQPLDYSVTVTFHGADGSTGSGYSGDVSVGPGASQEAQVDAVGHRGPVPVSCDVTDVSTS